MRAELGGGGWCVVGGGDVGGELFVAGGVLAEDDHGLGDVGVGGEHGFDLFQFDAQAAEFDLGVDASEEFEL